MLSREDLILTNNEHSFFKLNQEGLMRFGYELKNKEITHCPECGTEIVVHGPIKNEGYIEWGVGGPKAYKVDSKIVEYIYECDVCKVSVTVSILEDEIIEVRPLKIQ